MKSVVAAKNTQNTHWPVKLFSSLVVVVLNWGNWKYTEKGSIEFVIAIVSEFPIKKVYSELYCYILHLEETLIDR